MTTHDTFGHDLSRWLREDGEHRVPDHLAEVLMQTRAMPQRAWWSSPERWIPMSTMTFTREANLRPIAILVFALAALLIAALGVLYVASQRTVPVFGLAQNGLIIATDGTKLKAFQPDGTAPTVLAELEPIVFTIGSRFGSLAISPDGAHVAYVVDGQRLVVTTLATGATVELPGAEVARPGDPVSWSPDSTQFAFAGGDDDVEHVYVAASDGSSISVVGDGSIDESLMILQPAWSADGEWIAFIGTRSEQGELFLIRPDGTDLHALPIGPVAAADGSGPTWAPDPGVQRLLYAVYDDNEHRAPRQGRATLATRLFDVAIGEDYDTSLGFWPAWSPDGTRISGCCATVVDTADVLAGDPDPVTVFAQPEGNCAELEAYSGQAICGPARWSPDGTRLISIDVVDNALLIAPVDGSGPPERVDFESDTYREDAHWAWQPIRR